MKPRACQYVSSCMRYLFCSLILLASSSGFSQDAWKNIYSQNAWKERDQWQQADKIIEKLSIGVGSKVADIGCHEGYMSLKLAKVVGNLGRIYAVDVEQYKLDKLSEYAKELNVVNIIPVKGDYDNPHLPMGLLDAALIIDTYHEMDNHDDILTHIMESLKPGGKLVICEPIATERRKSERSDQERKHELGIDFALDDLRKAGFKIVFQKDPYIDREKIKGDKMWIIVAQKI